MRVTLIFQVICVLLLITAGTAGAEGSTGYTGYVKGLTTTVYFVDDGSDKIIKAAVIAKAPNTNPNVISSFSPDTNILTLRISFDRCIFYSTCELFHSPGTTTTMGNGTVWLYMLGSGLRFSSGSNVAGSGRYFMYACGALVSVAFSSDGKKAVVKFSGITPYKCIGISLTDGEETDGFTTVVKTLSDLNIKIQTP